MATTGQKYPTAAVTAAESPWLDNNWTTPGNVVAADGATANVTATSFDSPDQTYVLKAYGFDFSSIPNGSEIDGVICRVNAFYRSGQGAGSLDLLQLLNASRAKVGTNQCATPVALTTNAATIISKGGATDKWGNALDAAWVKDPDFGVAIGILATQANADVDVDYVTLEVYYTPPEQHSGSAVLSGGGAETGSAAKGGQAAAGLSGNGTLAAIGLAGMLAAAAIFGGGPLTAQGAAARAGVAIVSGGGGLVASGQAGTEQHFGSGVLSGGGSIVGLGQKSSADGGTIPGGGGVAAVGGKQGQSASFLPGGGAPAAGGTKGAVGTSSVTGGGAIETQAEAARAGSGVLSGGGTIAASAAKEGKGTADASGGGTLAATGVAGQAESRSGAALLPGGGSILARGCVRLPVPAVVCEMEPMERLAECGRLERRSEAGPFITRRTESAQLQRIVEV